VFQKAKNFCGTSNFVNLTMIICIIVYTTVAGKLLRRNYKKDRHFIFLLFLYVFCYFQTSLGGRTWKINSLIPIVKKCYYCKISES
jgi:hypothetical protein